MAVQAKESAEVARAREKLKNRLRINDAKINTKTLHIAKISLEKKLARASKERIPLRDKEIELFDANHHPEKVRSKAILKLLKRIEKI